MFSVSERKRLIQSSWRRSVTPARSGAVPRADADWAPTVWQTKQALVRQTSPPISALASSTTKFSLTLTTGAGPEPFSEGPLAQAAAVATQATTAIRKTDISCLQVESGLRGEIWNGSITQPQINLVKNLLEP